jgi:hypothetical protein
VSIDINVSFQARRLVSGDAWNQALAGLRWDVKFASGLDVTRASGFQRGLFCGRRTGAEMCFGDLTLAEAMALGVADVKADRRVTFSFTHELEMAFVLAASCALCVLAEGICDDPQSGLTMTPALLQQQVNAMIARSSSLAGPEW